MFMLFGELLNSLDNQQELKNYVPHEVRDIVFQFLLIID